MKSPRQLLKGFFMNRGVALALCAIVVIACTLTNTRAKLGGKCEKAISWFYAGGYAGSENGESLDSLLNGVLDSAESVESVAGHYAVDCSASDAAGAALKEALAGGRGATADMHAAYTAFRGAMDELIARLRQTSMNERDAQSFQLGCEAYDADGAAIEASGYNDAVRGFLRSYDRFPANVLGAIAGVHFPELFA